MRFKDQSVVIVALMSFMVYFSCTKSYKREQGILSSILGQEVIIPSDLPSWILDTPFNNDNEFVDFKIITYIDSGDCTVCHMKLQEWDRYMNSLMSIEDCDISFAMIVNNRDLAEIDKWVESYQFKYPIILDSTGEFLKCNALPENEMYHTLLLDGNNKILAAGNPIVNPKIRSVYYQTMLGKDSEESIAYDRQSAIAMGIVNRGDTVEHAFTIVNPTENILTIQEIVPSCNCLIAQSSSDTISAGASTYVNVKFSTASDSGFFRRHVDIFYNENEKPERLTLHGYIK